MEAVFRLLNQISVLIVLRCSIAYQRKRHQAKGSVRQHPRRNRLPMLACENGSKNQRSILRALPDIDRFQTLHPSAYMPHPLLEQHGITQLEDMDNASQVRAVGVD